MRIGILTHHWVYNFGANLQALATQSALETMGLDTIFINYRESDKIQNYRKAIRPCQAEKHELFCDRYLNQSIILNTNQDVQDFCCDCTDVVLVGSDAVFSLVPRYDPLNLWRSIGKRNFKFTDELPPYWLNWAACKRGKRIFKASIAASAMGTNYFFLNPGLRKNVKRAVSCFDYISVRDNWTQKMINCFNGKQEKKIHICPDPVFSLNQNFTLTFSEKLDIDVSETILMAGYFNQAWLREFVTKAHDNGFSVANCPNPGNEFISDHFDFIIRLPLSPFQWYQLLSECAGYIGVRFHALAVCLANQTPVINIDPHASARFNKYGSKMFDLCVRAGMENKFFTPHKLFSTSPEMIYDLLFDKAGYNNGEQYRKTAGKNYMAILKKIISLAGKQQ